MQKLKTQNGITLIALVITIIVMLILVGVSVTVALNGGLFIAAQRAAIDTEIASEREQLLSIAIGAINNKGKVDLDKLDERILADGNFEKTGEDTETTRTYKNKKSENTYTIKQDASITLGNGSIDDETTAIPVGSYVRYNVTYKDVYSTTMPKFTADKGWRYLGTDSEGNHLIVSTGIPAILYYHWYDGDTIGNKVDRTGGKGNDWWATNTEITALPITSQYYTDKGYLYLQYQKEGYPSKYAAYGMRYKFENIPFVKNNMAKTNAGCYTLIEEYTTGITGSVFRAEGYEDKTKVQIRSLTLEDLNRATNSANRNKDRAETSLSSGFKDITGTDNIALGLFDMRKLTGYGETTDYDYWLAYPVPGKMYSVYSVADDFIDIHYTDSYYAPFGVRPVIVLSSEFYDIVESEVEGVYKIEDK